MKKPITILKSIIIAAVIGFVLFFAYTINGAYWKMHFEKREEEKQKTEETYINWCKYTGNAKQLTFKEWCSLNDAGLLRGSSCENHKSSQED